MLYRATHNVTNDEPCFNLAEVNLMNQTDGRWHRYEILVVVRNDELAEYRRDMGLRDNFKNKRNPEGLRIMGGVVDNGKIYIEETVGSLRVMAFQVREAPAFDRQELPALSKWQDRKRKSIFN